MESVTKQNLGVVFLTILQVAFLRLVSAVLLCCPNFPQMLFILCPNYSKLSPNVAHILSKFVKILPKLCPNFTQLFDQMLSKSSQMLSNCCPNLPKCCPIFTQILTKCCPNLPIVSQNMLIFCPNFAHILPFF